MRRFGAGIVIGCLFAGGAAALESKTAPVAKPPVTAAAPVSRDNTKAVQAEILRQKRWDERMRRATNSMCDRC